MNIIFLALALAAGMALPIQAAINSRLGDVLGQQPVLSALVSFSVGTLSLILVSVFMVDWGAVQQNLPNVGFNSGINHWWQWIGGMLGAFVVFTTIFLAPKIGVANTAFLMILGQVLMGMVVDSNGWFGIAIKPIHWSKFVGAAVMLIGASLFIMGPKWFAKA
jgi:transporter family-2 protein